MPERFTIDVVSDVICPWCFLGKRRLDVALAAMDKDVFIRWRPYMLDPTIPPEGLDRHQYMLNKFGAERLKTIHDPLIEAGKEMGIPFNFDLITRTPNTRDAHRLIRWAHTVERQTEMVERLFVAYWSEGKDLGDRDVLAHCAGDAGINAQHIRELLDTDQDVAETKTEIEHATNIGVTGSYALVGAQSPDVLVDAINRVATEVTEG
ncbi:MAG: DsbA family oxidoreductase [Alphaproteobacteria bacterium]|nr:DsbA family oxidoreductase [Alphaproteobacteria bacterium]